MSWVPQVHETVIVNLHGIPDMDFVLDFGKPDFDTILCTVTELRYGRDVDGNDFLSDLDVEGPFPNFRPNTTMYVYPNAVKPLKPVSDRKIKRIKSELDKWIKELT